MTLSRNSRVGVLAVTALLASTVAGLAGPLTERVAKGEPVRIGFATEVPYAYPGEGNAPLGYVNVITIEILKRMGIDKVEPVVTDWGGLIPGLQAERFDISTGGMDIIKVRCDNVAFSEPIGKAGPALLVPPGNPKNLHTYDDILKSEATMVTVAGYSFVEHAKAVGIPESKVIQVPGPTELLATVRTGRADVGVDTSSTLEHLASQAAGAVEVTDPEAMPDHFKNWTGIAFRNSDMDFLEKFNEVLKEYVGSEEMLQTASEFGYTAEILPGDVTTEWVCANR